MKPMKKLSNIAYQKFNGDFTLTRIDEYWRCCLGEIAWKVDPEEYDRQVGYMAKGETMNEAIENCIEKGIDIHTIEENFK